MTESSVSEGASNRLVLAMERAVGFALRHWRGLLNTVLLIYLGLPLLAPVFMAAGATLPARVIYTVYIPFCHQLPERSYFLFGESHVYSLDQLQTAGVATGNILQRRAYVGDHEHGYKAALCERDMAIYGSMFILGLVFALRKRRPPRLRIWWYVLLFVLPMAIDGTTQLVGLRESNWWLRTITGTLFGAGTLWFAYPYLNEALAPAPEK